MSSEGDNIVRPQSPFQEKYLKSNAKILVVGGAALRVA